MQAEANSASEPWDVALLRRGDSARLVQVAREGRLVRRFEGAPLRVDLSWVDEAAVALADAAATRNRNLTLVYPAPAGQLGVLMAAQIALGAVLKRHGHRQIGLLTGDPGGASRLWTELRLASPGQRVPLSESFPLWRAGPTGSAPMGRRPFTGVLIGRRWRDWPTTVTVVDHLSGPIDGTPSGTVLRLFADPLDRELETLASHGELLWGWSDSIISLWHADIETSARGTIPFSVANERLAAMAQGVDLGLEVLEHPPAEMAIEALRDDLATLSKAAGDPPPRNVLFGLKVAWGHALTLASLPCTPEQYDSHCGLPPRAARSTAEFAPEIAAWAKTLDGDLADYADMVATDLNDLRSALTSGNPMTRASLKHWQAPGGCLSVFRTRTAANSWADAAPVSMDVERGTESLPRATWYSRIGKEATCPQAYVVGAPSRSAWHRLDSGLASQLTVAVFGKGEAERVERAARAVRLARARWASLAQRERVWRALVDDSPPPPPLDVPLVEPTVSVESGPAYEPRLDPFSPLGRLLTDDRPLISEEGPTEMIARQGNGEWSTYVDAVEVETDQGIVLLAADQEVDVLRGADEPGTCLARELKSGLRLILGREEGRVGLLDALEDTLLHRPDILAARLLARDLRERIQLAFLKTGMTATDVYDGLRAHGCRKTQQSVRSWLRPSGPLAPRDFDDLERLVQVLGIEHNPGWLKEVFAGVTRLRVFRRAAGKALHQAATASISGADETRIDPETGLSIADLREAVVIVEVRGVSPMPTQARVIDLGRLSA